MQQQSVAELAPGPPGCFSKALAAPPCSKEAEALALVYMQLPKAQEVKMGPEAVCIPFTESESLVNGNHTLQHASRGPSACGSHSSLVSSIENDQSSI